MAERHPAPDDAGELVIGIDVHGQRFLDRTPVDSATLRQGLEKRFREHLKPSTTVMAVMIPCRYPTGSGDFGGGSPWPACVARSDGESTSQLLCMMSDDVVESRIARGEARV
jgi:hypothetical protein